MPKFKFIFARIMLAFGIVAATSPLRNLNADEVRSPPGTFTSAATRQAAWQAVLRFLRAQGFGEAELPQIEGLDLPGSLPALAGRRLRAKSACWDERSQRIQFEIECGATGQCLPFFVYLRNAAADRAYHAHNNHREPQVQPCQPGPQPQRLPKEASSVPAPSAQPATHPGERATAIFVSDHFRMTAIVTCLDRGREGEVIRVRSQNGQVFRARISGPAMLEAVQ